MTPLFRWFFQPKTQRHQPSIRSAAAVFRLSMRCIGQVSEMTADDVLMWIEQGVLKDMWREVSARSGNLSQDEAADVLGPLSMPYFQTLLGGDRQLCFTYFPDLLKAASLLMTERRLKAVTLNRIIKIVQFHESGQKGSAVEAIYPDLFIPQGSIERVVDDVFANARGVIPDLGLIPEDSLPREPEEDGLSIGEGETQEPNPQGSIHGSMWVVGGTLPS